MTSAEIREEEVAGDSEAESVRSCSVESEASSARLWPLSCESCVDVYPRLDACSSWTNEKHNLYLDRLEESFVNQLHETKRLHHRLAENKTCRTPPSIYPSSDQFSILRNGCWQKNGFEKSKVVLHAAIDHCRSRSTISTCSVDSNENLELESECDSCLGNLGSSTVEASGQNFVENSDLKVASSSASTSKRVKRTNKSENSTSGQVQKYKTTSSSARPVPFLVE